jgi:hypothetical protein
LHLLGSSPVNRLTDMVDVYETLPSKPETFVNTDVGGKAITKLTINALKLIQDEKTFSFLTSY